MKNNRRKFIKNAGSLLAGPMLLPVFETLPANDVTKLLDRNKHLSAAALAKNEDFWYQISKSYTLTSEYLNLENGYYSLMSNEVLNAQIKHLKQVNESPSWHMRKVQHGQRRRVKRELAAFAGVAPEEIAILRNTTEALNILILGLELPEGSEMLYNVQDYFSMKEAIQIRAQHSSQKARQLELPLHKMSNAEIIRAYEEAITPDTKLLLLTHLINVTGQILPVRELCEMAESRGVEVIVDAAHSFAHIPFKIADLKCRYLGSSLHKWLGAPLGTGMLYIQKDQIQRVRPLIGCTAYKETDIRKFEYFGTHPAHSDLSISTALQFHQSLGSERIAARLHYLKNYWIEKVKDLPGLSVQTPTEEGRSCAIANVVVKGMPVRELEKKILADYGIHVMAIDYQGVNGLRITPHLYTLLPDLDRVVQAFRDICAK